MLRYHLAYDKYDKSKWGFVMGQFAIYYLTIVNFEVLLYRANRCLVLFKKRAGVYS